MTILRLLLSLGTLAILLFADVSSCSAAMMLFQDGSARPSISPQRFVQGRSDTASFQVFGTSNGFIPATACFFNTTTNLCTQALGLFPSPTNPGVAVISIPATGTDGNVLPQGTYTIRVTGQDGRMYVVTIEVVRAQLIQWVHGLNEDYAEYWDLYGREFTNDRLADFNFQHYPSANGSNRIFEYADNLPLPLKSSFVHPTAPGIETIGKAIVSVWNQPIGTAMQRGFQNADVPFNGSKGVFNRGAFRYNVSQDNKPPIMIAHSMGGIVARSVANTIATNPGLNPSTGQLGGIITVGTPNQGAQIVQSVNDGTADYSIAAAAQHIIAGPSFTLVNLGFNIASASIPFLQLGLSFSQPVIIGLATTAIGAAGIGIGAATTLGGAVGSAISLMPSQLLVRGVKSAMGLDPNISILAPAVNSTGIQDMSPNSALMQSIQSSPVPIISMYGKVSTQNDNPHWRIASTFAQSPPWEDRAERLALGNVLNFYGYNNLLPQHEKDFTPEGKSYKTEENYDNFVADMTNWTLLPIYWGATAWSTAVSLTNFVGGNIFGGIWHAFGAVQWSRGATYLTWTAKHDWNKLIGAQKIVQRPTLVVRTQPNFPWIFIGNELRDYLEDEDGDGLFGEEAQQYRGVNAVGFYRADGVSHNMSSNHPNAKAQFERAFNNQLLPFYAPRRRNQP